MLTSLQHLLAKARRGHYAIPAFNITNLETVQAVLTAAAKTKSPVILQTSMKAIAYAGAHTILALMQTAAREYAPEIPVVTHLDHGKDIKVVRECVQLGYASVHMDASEKPFAQNVSLTRQAVALGHRRGVLVQGELGYLLGYEGMRKIRFDVAKLARSMTDPDQAHEYVRRTGIDTLAVAVGTAHGYFKGKEKIDFSRLKAIAQRVRIPLVLHGGSGVSDAHVRKAIAHGVAVINLDTALRLEFLSGLKQSLGAASRRAATVDIRTYLAQARLFMEREAIRLIRLLGSDRKA